MTRDLPAHALDVAVNTAVAGALVWAVLAGLGAKMLVEGY